MITVVGLDGRTAASVHGALDGAGLVVGARRHLAACAVPPSARVVELGPVQPAVEALRSHDGDAVVLASGDPGFFGILRRLRAEGLSCVVEPGVSSVARLAAHAGLPWNDALVVSAHGRDPGPAANACRAHPKVAVLTSPLYGPADLARDLAGWDRRLLVGENLGDEDERVSDVGLGEAASRDWAHLSVVLALGSAQTQGPVWHAGGLRGGRRFGLDDDDFDSRGGMLTKSEIRATVLARLGAGLGDLVWDVGSGSGSVAVESARLGAAVVAVDHDPGAGGLVAANARRHGVDVRFVHGAAPPVLDDLPDPDLVFVGGGGPDVVAACAARAPRTIVLTLAAPERIGAVRAALEDFRFGGTVVQASRLAPLPDGTARLAATNPVTVVWGER